MTGVDQLYIAYDEKMMVVSALPLRIEGGASEVYRWGGVVQLNPAAVEDVSAGMAAIRVLAGFGMFVALSLAAMNQHRFWPLAPPTRCSTSPRPWNGGRACGSCTTTWPPRSWTA
jgi:hypothetical protein